jgi:hypothetical protein
MREIKKPQTIRGFPLFHIVRRRNLPEHTEFMRSDLNLDITYCAKQGPVISGLKLAKGKNLFME